ncbi:MAG: transglutaminase family protein [Burkholderiales bacterium]|nr:transglutaminase family protein [Burkholderiales bacterium]
MSGRRWAGSRIVGGHASYRVTHETRYTYAGKVTSAHQLAHLQPRNTSWQRVVHHAINIEPQPAERADGVDYFGNGVVRFMIDAPHDVLGVIAESVVEIDAHAPDVAAASPAWEEALAPPGVWGPDTDLEVEHYRVASPMVPIMEESIAYARPSFAPGRPWLDAALDLTRRIHAEFRYDPKATTVSTQVSEVLEHRRGVCQDFAHLMLSCLRSLGLPARYVSGYVLNDVPAGEQRLSGADASHAWVAAHCPVLGWVAFDPTNGKLADLEFVTLGWGREFSDVTPLCGVVLGGAMQELTVVVKVEPLVA